MKKRKYTTIIISSQGAENVQIFDISRIPIYLTLIFIISCLVTIGYLSVNYLKFCSRLIEFDTLTELSRIQEEQIDKFAGMVEEISTRIDELKKSDKRLRTIVELDEFTPKEETFGIGGPFPGMGRNTSKPDIGYNAMVRKLSIDIEHLEKESRLQEESITELITFLEGQEHHLANTPSIVPTRGYYNPNGFGYRSDPITGKIRMHNGVDIINQRGTPIFASADGVVAFTGIRSGYGKFVVIDHGYGITTCYGHLDSIQVFEGDRLKRGDRIGTIGSTGRTIGSHLHYEVRINDVPVDPTKFFLN